VLELFRDGCLRVTIAESDLAAEDEPVALEPDGAGPRFDHRQISLLRIDAPLLMVTSRYRFLLTTPSHLLDLQEMGLEASDFFHLREDEIITALASWKMIKLGEKLLLVTGKGYVRAYLLTNLLESLESPNPFQFDQPLPGLPVAMLGAVAADQVAIVLDNGRGTRLPVSILPTLGMQAISRREPDRVVSAALVREPDELLLLTADGYARRLESGWIPVPPRANTPGRALVARLPLQGMAVVQQDRPIWAACAGKLIPVPANHLDADSPTSTKSYRLLRLSPEQQLSALASI
jgi:DNA gyrase/topoisomerase IV subunit A